MENKTPIRHYCFIMKAIDVFLQSYHVVLEDFVGL